MSLKIDHKINDISIVGGGEPTFDGNTVALVANNLSDLTNITTARTNLGLGDAVTYDFTASGVGLNGTATIISRGDHQHALGTDTTGSYVGQGATSGNGLSGSLNAEGGTFTVTSNATNLNTASTIVFRDASGNFNAGTITANLTGIASIAASVEANSVALGTDTTGSYVATISGTTNEIEVTGSGSETSAVTIGLPNDVTVGNNLIVTGNLTVNGTTTTINSSTVSTGDNIIVLNADVTGVPTEDAGFEIERGTSSNVMFLWNETLDIWDVTRDGTTYYEVLDRSHFGTTSGTITEGNDSRLHTHSNESILNATTASFLTADETKLDFISITQAVDLDAIESDTATNNAKVSNITTNLGYTASPTDGTVTSSDGTDATIPLVIAAGNAGLITGADKTKLNSITVANLVETDDIGVTVQAYTKETSATSNPTVTDDVNAGYIVGSRWVNTVTDAEFVLLDSTASAAVWKETTSKGEWGSIIGTLSNQTDIQGELDLKSDTDHSHITWSVVTGNITVVANNSYILDSSLGTFTVTLPASPSVDDTIRFIDAGAASINNIPLDRNGSNINGLAENLIIDVGNSEFTVVYLNVTDGWVVAGGGTLVEFVTDGIEPYYDNGTVAATGTVTIDLNNGTWQKITYPTTGVYTVTIAFANWTIGAGRSVTLELENFGDLDATIIWPAAMKTSGGAALSLSTGTDFVSLMSRDNGTTIHAFQSGEAMA